MIIAAPCVPHTGHHFMIKRILYGFHFESAAVNPAKYDESEPFVAIADHFHLDKRMNWIAWIKIYPAFVTLRHPARCWLSHEKRSNSMHNTKRFFDQWTEMMAILENACSLYFIHLDDKELREEQAQRMLNVIGMHREIDWSVNLESGAKKGTHEAELTDELLTEVPASFIQYYEDSKRIQ